MTRLIDADKLHPDRLTIEGNLAISQNQIANAPTILPCDECHDKMDSIRRAYDKAMARPKGEWIFRQGTTCGGYYKCSECGEVERAEKNFCPICGADMRGKEE